MGKDGICMKKLVLILLASILLLCGCSKKSTTDGIDIDNHIKSLGSLDEYIILGDYKDISITEISVTASRLSAYKSSLMEQYAYYPKLDKNIVEKGDNINVSFVSYLNNTAFEGGSGSDDIIVGDGQFVFPELEASMIGMAVGNTARLQVTVPNDYFSEGLRGKTIRMDITIKQIQDKEKTTPDITDEFVKTNFELDSVKAFDAYIEEQVKKEIENEMMQQAWKQALGNCEIIRYPDGLIDKYVEEMLTHYTEQAKKYDAGPEIFVGNVDEWKAEAKKFAEDYYKSEIAMYAILDKEFGRDIVTSEYKRRLEGYAKDRGITVAELKEKYSKEELITSMYWDKVMELVWENCKLV